MATKLDMLFAIGIVISLFGCTSVFAQNETEAAEYMEELDAQRTIRLADSTTGPTMETTDPTMGPTTTVPTMGPTTGPTMGPMTTDPTMETTDPTMGPITGPTMGPTTGPTMGPTTGPTMGPTTGPTMETTTVPTMGPTTTGPTMGPTTTVPTMGPTTTTGPTDGLCTDPNDEAQALKDINEMEVEIQKLLVVAYEADWLDNTDHTEAHENASAVAFAEVSQAYSIYWNNVINCYNYKNFNDPVLKRRFDLQATPGTTALSIEDQKQLEEAINTMTGYSLLKICPYDKQDCNVTGEGYSMDQLEVVIATSQDMEELEYYWEEWRDTAGAPTKPSFLVYVDLLNKAARMPENNFTDASDMWVDAYKAPGYTTADFKTEIDELWEAMSGLYYNLHAYVRYRLRGDGSPYKNQFGETSPIPAHILGNMWAQSWENVYDLVKPYDDELLDITEALENNIEDVREMFGYAEDFFVKTGLFPMTQDFKDKTMYEDPAPNKTAVCHASAWDFMSIVNPQVEGDFRIKMCTDKNQEEFIVIHHEMGHTEYQMSYSQDENGVVRPLIFRDGANPGFHEAIGDTIALSVSTPNQLEYLYEQITGETMTSNSTYHRDINQLMKMALAKVAFIPYAYILDKFRWNVFQELYNDDELNFEWWKMRVNVQGLKPPILREKDEDFDPGCKYHVSAGVPYVRYFVAHILQFQFHQKLCEIKAQVTGETEPIYLCNIYEITEAGEHLKKMLQKGASEPWTTQLADFLEVETGRMNVSAIQEYFEPLNNFLKTEIEARSIPTTIDEDVEKYFVQYIPATVPIVVGIVLLCMIGIVIVAFFVGKRRQKLKENKAEVESGEKPKGVDNLAMELEERKASVSSSGSSNKS